MKYFALLLFTLATLVAFVPSAAFAHTGVGDTVGFLHGVMHPIAGLDHALAMVMVGLFAWQLGGRALWLVPAAFVLVMALGAAFGVAGVALPYVEVGIALSVVVLGAMVAFGVGLPLATAMATAGLLAVFHGHAHGAEMPESVAGLAYGVGFMAATALLHAAGIAIGFLVGWLGARQGPVVMRSAGATAALAGVAILSGLI